MTPQAPYDAGAGATLARITIRKEFIGDLVGTSTLEMLSAVSEMKGSAGYVALERVTGVLGGRAGTFVLQHSGTMNRGRPSLSVSVVPDSGTDALRGLEGTMKIEVADGKHGYTFEYVLK